MTASPIAMPLRYRVRAALKPDFDQRAPAFDNSENNGDAAEGRGWWRRRSGENLAFDGAIIAANACLGVVADVRRKASGL